MLLTRPSVTAPQAHVMRVPGASPALQLAQQGWYCERGFFDADDVMALRAELAAAFEAPQFRDSLVRSPGCGSIFLDLFRLPHVYRQMFSPRMARLLTTLIGPGFVLLPEHAAHSDGFGGWHKDTDMLEFAGQTAHWSNDYGIFQCAVYLQDNSQDGGGLSIVPGSHRVPRPSRSEPDAAQRFQARAAQHGVRLDSAAGDLVVFHTRLDHRATPKVTEVPAYGQKLALFFIAGWDNRHSQSYNEFIHNRKDYAYLRTYCVPEDMRLLAREHGFRFA